MSETTEEQAPTRTAAAVPGDDPDEGASIRQVWRVTRWCLVFALLGHVLVYVGYLARSRGYDAIDVPWQPAVGVSLAAVAVVALGGFYAASRRSRVAIGASFILTFLLLLSYQLSIAELSRATDAEGGGGAVDMLKDLRSSVTLIVGFYFGSEAAINVAKAIGIGFGRPENAAEVQLSDRDVAVFAARRSRHRA